MKQGIEWPNPEPKPAPETAATYAFYRERAQPYFERTIDVQMDHLYRPFLEAVGKSGRILDVGCGSGRDVKRFRALGYEAFGIDPSPELVALASAHVGPYFTIAHAETYETIGDLFDAIWACASLLHLPRKLLSSTIRHLATLLTPEGIFFASVQSGEGERVQSDGRQFTYYSASEFEGAFKEAGLLVLRTWVTHDAMRADGPIWINVLARRECELEPSC